MKRGIALLMALVMALALTVCTQTPPPNRGDVEGAAEPDAGYSAGDADIVQLNGFRSIHIDWTSGRVTVELYDGQGIELSETMMDGGDVSLKMEWRVDEDDSTLDILSQPLTVSASEKKHLTVKLPRSMVLHELDINAVSADVSVDLTEEDTLTLQELDVSSVSGSVELMLDVLPAKLEAETTSGDVTLTLPAQPDVPVCIVTRTVSGQFRSEVGSTPDAANLWELETVSGSMTVSVAK